MSKPILHFVHANSFPAETYRIFFNHLRKHYDVQALSLHAHDPKFPVQDGWRALMQELVEILTSRYDQPVILVGHSMGGMLALMLAKARPDLVRCVVLLDSPVIAGWRALALRIAKSAGLGFQVLPARISKKRRKTWPDVESAYRHFASKPKFAAWDPRVLRDYIEHGLLPHPEGVTLRFTRRAETAVYLGVPDDIGAMVRRSFHVPVGFIGGDNSEECRAAGYSATRRLVRTHFKIIPGSHLFPMEVPAEAAMALHKMVQSII